MDERSKRIPSDTPHEILNGHNQLHVPRIARIGQRDTVARVPQRLVNERAVVGIAADDPIERAFPGDPTAGARHPARRSERAPWALPQARRDARPAERIRGSAADPGGPGRDDAYGVSGTLELSHVGPHEMARRIVLRRRITGADDGDAQGAARW